MKKGYWIFGIITGCLLIILQVWHHQAMAGNWRIEVFGSAVAVFFIIVGAWLGLNLKSKYPELEPVLGAAGKTPTDGLSDRELDVLRLMTEGHTNQEIADRLFISLNTVKTHLSRIYQKLHVQRRTQAIRRAQQLGWIPNQNHSQTINHPNG